MQFTPKMAPKFLLRLRLLRLILLLLVLRHTTTSIGMIRFLHLHMRNLFSSACVLDSYVSFVVVAADGCCCRQCKLQHAALLGGTREMQ